MYGTSQEHVDPSDREVTYESGLEVAQVGQGKSILQGDDEDLRRVSVHIQD